MATRRQKTCTKCGKEQAIENFGFRKRTKDGLDFWCNRCNADAVNESCKRWYEKNKKKKIANQKEYKKKRFKENVQVRLRDTYRRRIKSAIANTTGKKKTTSTSILLGCSVQELRIHLEVQFKPGMIWENYGRGIGKWSIDHIKPCASFDLTNIEEQMVCFHYSNLQPLWYEENSAKGAKYTEKK